MPEQDLVDRLAGVPGRGTYEAHITTDASGEADRDRFRDLCTALGVKCVLIELDAGESRSQPMTASYHRGELASVTQEVAGLASALRLAGFPVARLKLEAVAGNEGVPETDAEAAHLPAENYFEFHLKLRLPVDADLAAISSVCARHAARLSRNALKRDTRGLAERFVTLRAYRCGRATALAALDRLTADLTAAGFPPVDRLREYSLYDSAATLDAGWLDRPGSGT